MSKVSITAHKDQEGFSIKNLGGYTLSIGIGSRHYCENGFGPDREDSETTTMEVAIMDKNENFVCLPDDVSGHVSVSKLEHIITAIKVHDWHQVCWLCDEEAIKSKFPTKAMKA
jgi:hypothetical protein